jgi:hypothetical protein
MITGRDAERLAFMGKSKQRIAVARARKRRQMRWFWLLIFAGIALTVGWFWVADSTPEPPGLVVRWPKPKVSQRVSNGSTLLFRRGNAFVLSTTDPEAWDVSYSSDTISGKADAKGEVRWLPSKDGASITLRCRPKTSGWKRTLSWFWPQTTLSVSALAPRAVGNFRFEATPPPGGMWVYPFTYLKKPAAWDEPALQLLCEPLLPALSGQLELSSGATMPAVTPPVPMGTLSAGDKKSAGPDQPLWWIVPAFSENAMENAAGDPGTYARLNSSQPERDMSRVALLIARKRPEASFRYVVRLDTKPPGGILRVAFDGKADRKAWVRRPGESAGGPIEWPEVTTESVLVPSEPR